MKRRKFINKIITMLIILLPLSVSATELNSPNYKIVGVTTNTGGVTQTIDGDYSALLEAGRVSNNPRN